jgi:hypothetical protein
MHAKLKHIWKTCSVENRHKFKHRLLCYLIIHMNNGI